MSVNLYHEAIAEAKQLREMAEQNAKNKIIDAVTPKIRRLIEKQLLGEDALDDSEEMDDVSDDIVLDDESADTTDTGLSSPEGTTPTTGTADAPPATDDVITLDLDDLASDHGTDMASYSMDSSDELAVDSSGESGGPSLTVPAESDVNVQVASDGGVNVDTGKVSIDLATSGEDFDSDDDELLLDEPVAEALALLLKRRRQGKSVMIENKISKVENKLLSFKNILEALEDKELSSPQRAIIRNHYINLLKEVGSLKGDAILTERESSSNRLQQRVIAIIKEIKKMSNSRDSRFARLFESDRLELDELDAVLTFEKPEDEEEAAEVEDLLSSLEVEVEVGDDDADEEADEEPAEDEELALDDEGEEEGLDLEEMAYEVDEMDEGEVLEIDESMLRKELLRMRTLKETSGVEDPAKTADAFGGGDVDDEMFVDVDEETLLNVLADELGSVKASSGAAAVEESRRRRSRRSKRFNESRQNRALKLKLAEYQKAVKTLRTQLSEMNLFNAKLLYANKLMQNRNITAKQQRQVVHALDEAKTLREAKLLYKSLSTSLQRRSASKLQESRIRTSGSSSKSTRSASPVQNGVEAGRWAVLAGIKE